MADFAEMTDDDFTVSVGRLTLAEKPQPPMAVVERKAVSFTEQLIAHQITDDASYVQCDELFHAAVIMLDEISATFDPIIADAHRAHKTACAQKSKYTKPIQDALALLKQRFLAEKTVRDAKAEELRLQLEAQLRQEAADRQLNEAVALADAGRTEESEMVFDEPTPQPSVPIEAVRHRVAPKLSKTSTSGQWKCTKVDLRKLAKAVADGLVPESYIEANTTALDARARADKTAFNVPGCKAELVPNVVVRR